MMNKLEHRSVVVYEWARFKQFDAAVSRDAWFLRTYGGGPDGGYVLLLDIETSIRLKYVETWGNDPFTESPLQHHGIFTANRRWTDYWDLAPQPDSCVYLYNAEGPHVIVETVVVMEYLIAKQILPADGILLRPAADTYDLRVEHNLEAAVKDELQDILFKHHPDVFFEADNDEILDDLYKVFTALEEGKGRAISVNDPNVEMIEMSSDPASIAAALTKQEDLALQKVRANFHKMFGGLSTK